MPNSYILVKLWPLCFTRIEIIVDRITTQRRSANMSKIKSKGMKPEMLVRSLAHGMGYRYRLHRKDLPGKPDLVFPRLRKAIFVHGCFWHQHSIENCRRSHIPRSNREYWQPKLDRNIARDKFALLELTRLGWETLVLWECELKNAEQLEARVKEFLGPNNRSKVRVN
jgi:DNA mismatch endonuclease (patch repair protein)